MADSNTSSSLNVVEASHTQKAHNEIINYMLPTLCTELLLASLTGSFVLVGGQCGVLKAM